MTKKFLSLFLAITMLLGVGSIASAEETVEMRSNGSSRPARCLRHGI